VLLASGLLVALTAPGGVAGGFVGLFLLVIGAAMITPAVIHLAYRFPGSAAMPLLWRMGIRDLDRHLSRLGVAVAALMVALSAGVGVGVMVDSMRTAVDTWLDALLSADLYVASAAHRDGAMLPADVVAGLSALPAVQAASRYRHGSVRLLRRQVDLIGAHLSDPSRQGFELLSGSAAATWTAFDRGGVLISEPLAWHLGLERGAVLNLPTASASARFTVAGIFRDYASEHGRIFMDEASFLKHWPDAPVSSLALFAAGGDVGRLRRALDAALPGRHDLAVTPASAIHEESLAVFDRTFRITGVLRALLLIVAFIGVFGALMALQLERGKEFAVWRALGMRRIQIAALIGGESLVMGCVAACLAVPVGLLMAWLLVVSIQRRAFGWTMALDIYPGVLLQVLLVGLAAAALAAVYPLWRSASRDPAPLLREE
jgi:putative ABC transport system permease protein